MQLVLCLFIFLNTSYARTIKVMSYNVENLFDTEHDIENGKDKKDWSYLPKGTKGKEEACKGEKKYRQRKECLDADWTDAKLKMKISNLSDVIKHEGKPVDMLAVIEVENLNVVKKLAEASGFENIEITTSPDERGVDVALLFKNSKDIVKVSRKEHLVPLDYGTRNILEVEFLIDGKYPLTVFVNHWPSLQNPDSTRIKAADVLRSRTLEILKEKPNMSILSMGDFNTIDENDPHPFKTVLFKENLYFDVGSEFLSSKLIDDKMKAKNPMGTYYFAPKDQWNYLDHFFYTSNLQDQKDLEIDIKSFEIYSANFFQKELHRKSGAGDEKSVKTVLVSKRFEIDANSKEEIGYSDHYPIVIDLNYPDEVKKIEKKLNVKQKKAKNQK